MAAGEKDGKGGRDAPAARGPSVGGLIVATLAVSLISAGIGAGHALFFGDRQPKSSAVPVAEAQPATPAASAPLAMKDLPPIVANLGVPPEQWVRLEASFVLDAAVAKEADLMSRQIADDLVAYLRTARFDEFATPEGFAEFRREVDERAATRTGGKVRKLYLQTMVVQ